MKNKFKQRSSLSRGKASSTLKSFDEKTPDSKKELEKEVKKETEKALNELHKKWDPEHSESTELKRKKLDSGIKGEFVDLDDLHKNAEKVVKKDPARKVKLGKDIFSALEKLRKNQKEDVIPDKKSDKTPKRQKRQDTKKTDELFDKLASIKSKNKDSEKEISDKKQTSNEDKNINNKQEQSNEKESINSKKQKQSDVFADLSNIGTKTKTKKEELPELESEKKDFLSSDQMINLFKEKKLNIDVFQLILSELLKTNKLNKQDVSNIIFKLLEKQLIEKSKAQKILKELDLIN